MGIEEKIEGLNEKDKKVFGQTLWNNLYNEKWCEENEIGCKDQTLKEIEIARERTYQEMEERGYFK